MQKFLRLLFFIVSVVFLAYDNIRIHNSYASQNTLSDLLHKTGFVQNGWGMYSFDLKEQRSVEIRYLLKDKIIDQVPGYGDKASFKKTILGNLEPTVVSTNDENIWRGFADYRCRYPVTEKEFDQLQIILKTRKVPTLTNSNYSNRNTFFSSSVLYTFKCSGNGKVN